MLLIDAIFIHNGGGKVLLNYLIEELEKTDYKVFYLFDERFPYQQYAIKSTNMIAVQKASLFKRHGFYKKNGCKFNKVFILGNIPPTIKLRGETIVYFHNAIYLSVPRSFSILQRLKYKLKIAIIRCFEPNVSRWLVQTEYIKNKFSEKFAKIEKVEILPFYPTLEVRKKNRIPHSFFYVSNAQENKNHIRLIDAFCKSFDQLKKGRLILTVSGDFPDIVEHINQAIKNGYPIENVGFLQKEALVEKYAESEFVIFPSLSESFGLGIIEGIRAGCNIIGADLPYTYAVCRPSAVFNPYDIDDISKVINKVILSSVCKSTSLVTDEMFNLITILNSNDNS